MKNDSTEPTVLGERLQLARTQAGLTTRAVSERLVSKLSLSHATIANYEKGKSVPSVIVLQHLAELYGRDLAWFLRTGPKLTGVQFRKVSSRVKVSEEEAYKAQAQRWLEAYVRLEQHLQIQPRNDWRKIVELKPGDSGEVLAARVRKQILHLGDDTPIASIVEVIEERFGIRVLELATDSKIDGFAALYGGEPVIVLNPTVSYDRARLNAGHEAGHILFGDTHEAAVRDKKNEDRGFEFGFNLLLPRAALDEAFRGQSMVKLVRYKERFGISLAAMVYRAQNVGILTKKQTTALWIEFSRRGWREKEPGQVRADRAIRFERLYEEALGDKRLKPAEVPSVLGVRDDEMRRRVEEAAGFSAVVGEVEEDDCEEGETGGESSVIPFPR